jgi:hypothetical protein
MLLPIAYTRNFLKKEPTLNWLYQETSSQSDYNLCPALKQNLGAHIVKDDRDVTRRLIRKGTGWYQQGKRELDCGRSYTEK